MYERLLGGPTYTVAVWAGSDLYSIVSLPLTLKDDVEKEYQELHKRLMSEIVADFGQGVELKRRCNQHYDICVEHVVMDVI